MKKITALPLIALISLSAEAIQNEESCSTKGDELFLMRKIEVSEGINDYELDEIESILSDCSNIEIGDLDDEEVMEYLRNTGWTWQ